MERSPSLSDLNSLVYGQVGLIFLFIVGNWYIMHSFIFQGIKFIADVLVTKSLSFDCLVMK